MPALRIGIDLHGLDLDRPAGPARYARRLVEAMRALPGEHVLDVWEPGSAPRPADVVLALGGRPRIGRSAPVVAAVYDLAHLLAPASFGALERWRRGFAGAWLVRQSAHVLAPSRGIATALATYLRVPDSRLTWLPSFGPGWTRAPRADVQAELHELGLAGPYLLFAGTPSRRKNLGVLLEAWQRLPAATRPALVLCGPGRPPELPAGVRALGYVGDESLRRLLSGATAYVAPSLAEGCAMGTLEAMATGAPPIVSAGTAGAEVSGTAGIAVPAADVAGWAAALRAVVEDTTLRNRMAARGLQAVRDLRAEAAAARCLEAAAAAARRWR